MKEYDVRMGWDATDRTLRRVRAADARSAARDYIEAKGRGERELRDMVIVYERLPAAPGLAIHHYRALDLLSPRSAGRTA